MAGEASRSLSPDLGSAAGNRAAAEPTHLPGDRNCQPAGADPTAVLAMSPSRAAVICLQRRPGVPATRAVQRQWPQTVWPAMLLRILPKAKADRERRRVGRTPP